MDKEEIKSFNTGEFDFGLVPADRELNEHEKRLASVTMAVNAAIVQFVIEGIIPFEEQVHFMGHLQDFISRIYRGDAVKLPGTAQTLALNSKAGNIFYEAAINALEHGEENFQKLQAIRAKWAEEAKAKANDTSEQSTPLPRTLH